MGTIRNEMENNKVYSASHPGDPLVDVVNHPPHYKANGFETIDIIEAYTKDLNGIEAVCAANVIKYICRWNNKNGLQDLLKCRWYLNKLIDVKSGKEGAENE